MVTLQDRLDIESCSTAQYRHLVTRQDVAVCGVKIVLVIEQRVLVARIPDIYQVIRNLPPRHPVIGKILSRTDIHSTINLARVGTDNLPVEPCGEMSSKSGFTAGSRPENSY